MRIKLKYVWDAGSSGSGLDVIDTENIKNDIAYMVINGCHTKKLKSKIKKLNSLNAKIL